MAYDAKLGYDPNMDYKRAMEQESDAQKRLQLASQREAKISANKDKYKDVVSTGDVLMQTAGGNMSVYSQPTQPPPDYKAQYDQLAQLQRQKAAVDLQAKYNSSLSGINAEQATIAPQYNQQRNLQDTQSKIAAKNFAEYYAARGQNNPSGMSGSNEQYKQSADIANLQALSGLYRQEQSANNDIARRKSDLNSALQTDLASASMGIDATALQNAIDIAQRERDRGIQIDQFNKNYNRGVLESDRNFNYQSGRDTVSDQRYNNEWNYQVGRDNVADQRYTDETNYKRQIDALELDFQRKQTEIDNAFRNRQLTAQERQNAIDNAFREKQYNQNVLESNRSYALQQQKASEPKAPTGGVTSSQISSYIDKNFITGTNSAGKPAMSMPDKRNIAEYLNELAESGTISEAILKQIAAKYGIQFE